MKWFGILWGAMENFYILGGLWKKRWNSENSRSTPTKDKKDCPLKGLKKGIKNYIWS